MVCGSRWPCAGLVVVRHHRGGRSLAPSPGQLVALGSSLGFAASVNFVKSLTRTDKPEKKI